MKAVLCIPIGRRRFLECLIPHVLAQRDVFDRCDLWVNPWESPQDEGLAEEIAAKAPQFFNIMDDGERGGQTGVFDLHYGRYYEHYTNEPDTIYVKCDDDIVWVQPGAFSRLVSARHDDDSSLLVIGNIVVNTLCNTLHKAYAHSGFRFSKGPHDSVGHHSSDFAAFAHNELLAHIGSNSVVENYDFGEYVQQDWEHTPNHVFAWWGRDTVHWLENGSDDERYVSTVAAQTLNRPIRYLGSAIFSHWAYTPQHRGMPMDTLAKYRAIAEALHV